MMADALAAEQDMATELRKLTRVDVMISEPDFANWDVYQVQERLERAVAAFDQFEKSHRIVMSGTVNQDRRMGLTAEFEAAEDLAVKIKTTLKKRLVELTPPPAPAAAAAAPAQIVQVQVAKQTEHTWGVFSGDFLEWKDFKTRFELAVHNMATLTPADKIAFLRNSLKGAAADAMQGYGLDPAKYEEFWQALNQKYDQKFTLANHYLANFFRLKKLDRNAGAADLSRLSNATKGLIRKIEEVQFPVENWDLIIVHSLQERLNAKYLDKWHGVRGNDENPTIEKMTKFLDETATLLETQKTMSITVQNEYAQRQPDGAAGGSGVNRVYPCSVCQSRDHEAENCGDFYPLILNDRLEVAKRNNMCHMCLKRGHHVKNCFSIHPCDEPACQNRGGRHHPLLCPIKNRVERVQNVYPMHGGHGNGRGTRSRDQSSSRS